MNIELGSTFTDPESQVVEIPVIRKPATDAKHMSNAPIDVELLYYKDIKNIPVLSHEEEIDLAQRKDEGDKEAREKLIWHNLRLVAARSRHFRYLCENSSLTILDLRSEGYFGLIEAVDKFDYREGVKFSTYASHWIRQKIQRAVDEHGTTIEFPIHMREKIAKMNRAKRKLEQSLGDNPNTDAVAQELGVTVCEINKWEAFNVLSDIRSLDEPIVIGNYEELDDNLADMIPLPEIEPSPYSALSPSEIQKLLQQIKNPIDKEIIERKFGLNSFPEQTLGEIAKDLKTTKTFVSKSLKQTLGFFRFVMQHFDEDKGFDSVNISGLGSVNVTEFYCLSDWERYIILARFKDFRSIEDLASELNQYPGEIVNALFVSIGKLKKSKLQDNT